MVLRTYRFESGREIPPAMTPRDPPADPLAAFAESQHGPHQGRLGGGAGGGSLGYHSARSTSVCEKSDPTKSSGSRRAIARA